jgi:P27 family predicted phage terminase small subunit
MSPQTPTPTKLKILRGNPGKQRLNRAEPKFKVEPLPQPPDFLSKIAKQEWRRITPELHRLGLLTCVDLSAFAAYCQAYARWVAAESALQVNGKMEFTLQTDRGNIVYNPLVGIASAACRDMVKYAAEFGLTPASRSRIATSDVVLDEFEGLLAN